MKKVSYINEMPYTFDAVHPVAHYRLKSGKYRNRGEILESIAKYHRGIFTEVNKNTSWNNGSDMEELNASIKSSKACIGRNFKGIHDPNQQIKAYFKGVASSLFIWMEWDEKTQMVTEYHMNKREFGAFVNEFTQFVRDSKMTDLAIRFRASSNKMRMWLDSRCA